MYHGLTSEFFLEKASQIGPNTKNVVQILLKAKPYPQLSYTECFGIIKTLKGTYGEEDVELACTQAIRLNSVGYRVVKSILQAGVRTMPEQLPIRLGNNVHENLRGPRYYH